jgi:UDP-glucose 4-epimerase
MFQKRGGCMARTVVVTGGAGYIGSHVVEQLVMQGDRVIVLDSLVYGQPWPELGVDQVQCVKGECGDARLLDSMFSHSSVDAVVHCAARIEVGASVKDPLSFYDTNVAQTLVLLDRMRAHDVKWIVFSSSAAVYGNSVTDPITEDSSRVPLNPYGHSKWFIEQVLADCALAYGLRYGVLRYFNVAGAYPEKSLGERHTPETHVVPLLLRAAHESISFNVYSADYGTADGSCVRDYVHVRDIARANVLALEALVSGADSFTVNIGSGRGVSVLELIHRVERVMNKQVPTRVVERRSGDAARLVADATRAKMFLGWQPRFGLEEMLQSAATFHGWKNCLHTMHQKYMDDCAS